MNLPLSSVTLMFLLWSGFFLHSGFTYDYRHGYHHKILMEKQQINSIPKCLRIKYSPTNCTQIPISPYVFISKKNANPDSLMNKGIALDEKGKYEEAITYYDKVLTIDPDNIDALYAKGSALDDLGKYEEAITYYDKVLAVSPNDADTLNSKGVALKNLGKYEEAITYYDKALAVDPNFVYSLNNKGVALDNLGKYEKAITNYDKALSINPKFPDSLNNKANAIVKLALEGPKISQNFYSLRPYYSYIVTTQTSPFTGNIKQIEEALQVYDKALAQDPNSPDILTNKGIALTKIGKNNEAVDLFNKALTANPEHAPALYNKSLILEKMGRSDEAYDLKQRAANIDPTYEGDFTNILATSHAFA